MDLLRVTLQYINFLAWPMLALGYPLYVSIRTIETGSNYDKMKIITYWIILSFIYLFEHVFEKLLEWVPLWSYLRLIFICWLVIPQLNGAFYLYQYLIHPYLLFKLPHAITQFYASCSEWYKKLKKDSSIKKETFLDVAESFLEQNGSEALEKLIGSKPECNEGGQILGEIQVVECTAKCDATKSNQVRSIDENLLQIEKQTSSAIHLETSYVQKFQDKWTCVICQVTTSSELTLQFHLRGKRHRAESKLWCNFCNLRVSGEIDMISHLKGKRHLATLEKAFAKARAS